MRSDSSGCELRGQLRIFRDALRMKLQVDPLLETHLLDRFDVAGPRSEGQPVERVENLLVLGELLLKLRVVDVGFLFRGRARATAAAQNASAKPNDLRTSASASHSIKRLTGPKVD